MAAPKFFGSSVSTLGRSQGTRSVLSRVCAYRWGQRSKSRYDEVIGLPAVCWPKIHPIRGLELALTPSRSRLDCGIAILP